MDEQPIPRQWPAPVVQRDARRRPLYGFVRLRAVVGADGEIEDSSVTIVTNSVHALLNTEAKRVVGGATFWPGCRNGEAVRVEIGAEVVFPSPRPIVSPRQAFLTGLLVGLGGLIGALIRGQ